MNIRRPVFNNQQSYKINKITHIFIGIDFGTSYTKVSYSYAPTKNPQINTVKWNNNFFKQSILYLKDERLYFEKPEAEYQEVKYFKYSIIEKTLQNTRYATKNNFEEMCCVYFLAQIIKRTLSYIIEALKLDNLEDIAISVNMGVPLENFYNGANVTNKGIFQDIIESAVVLAGGSKIRATLPDNQVLLYSLDDIYTELLHKKAKLNWDVNVHPELAAELLLYHTSPFVPEGIYAIVDAGGGTVDMALFKKDIFNRNVSMSCLSQTVLPFGVELLEKLDSDSEDIFQQAFSKMLVKSKDSLNVDYNNQRKIPVFFLGGGATNTWYIENIKKTRERLGQANIPELDFRQNIDNFISEEKSLIEKNQRLIISQMLAKHKAEIKDVQGFPNFYEQEKRQRTNANNEVQALADDLYERGQKYWD